MITRPSWPMRPGKRVLTGLQRMVVFLVVMSFALAWAPGAAAAPAQTLHYSFKGLNAIAHFDSISGCIETSVWVTAVDGTVKQPGHPEVSSFAYTLISEYDFCNDVQLLTADGGATLPADAFQMHNLNSATLNTSIEVFDDVSGAPLFPVDINVSWTGIGGTFEQKDHLQIKAPGIKVNVRTDGTYREAIATGTAILGTTNLTPEPAVEAWFVLAKSGEIDIYH